MRARRGGHRRRVDLSGRANRPTVRRSPQLRVAPDGAPRVTRKKDERLLGVAPASTDACLHSASPIGFLALPLRGRQASNLRLSLSLRFCSPTHSLLTRFFHFPFRVCFDVNSSRSGTRSHTHTYTHTRTEKTKCPEVVLLWPLFYAFRVFSPALSRKTRKT